MTGAGRSGVVLTLLSKPDCALCHEMRDVIEPVLRDYGATLVVRDIGEDAALARYRFEIPVLLLDGREVARHRLTAGELRERLARLGVAPARPEA